MKTTAPCDCAAQVNELLREQHSRLDIPFVLSVRTVTASIPRIATAKLGTAPRGAKVTMVLASFCPFCGQKYEDATK